MASERKMTVVITGNVNGLQGAVASANGSLGRIATKSVAVGNLISNGIQTGAQALFNFGKDAVSAGSDLNETLSKSNTVFGQQAKAIESWANGAAKGFGQSKQQALEAASSFGNMFDQLGVGEEKSAAMSKQMVELASDFASFHNADISEVLIAQQAAFRGEYDALQRFVPTISAATVEQEALAQTGKKSTKELTAQEKAIAVQTLMMKGAGDAMGDFARTSDGLANKQRMMSAQFEDVKAKIGQALIPVVLKVADVFLNKFIPAMQMITDKVQENWPQIKATITSAVQGISDFVRPIIEGVQDLWENFGDNILTFVKRVWPSIQQTISGALEVIRGVVQVVTSLIKGDWSGAWEGIKNIVHGAFNVIVGRIKTMLEIARLAVSVGMEAIGSIFRGAWNGIVSFFAGIPGRIGAIASAIWSAVKAGAEAALKWVYETFVGQWSALVGWFWSIPGKVREIAGRIWEGLKNGLGAAISWIRDQLDRLLGPLDEIAGKVGGIVGGIGNAAGGLFGGLFDDGGVVPGPRGAPRLILAHGGETIFPTHKSAPIPIAQAAGGGGTVVQVNVNGGTFLGTNQTQLKRELVAMLNNAGNKGIR